MLPLVHGCDPLWIFEDTGEERSLGRVGSVLITAVVAVLVTAAEAFSEVVVVRTLVFAIAVISVVRVLVGIGIAVVEVPAIFTVRDTRAIAFPIAVVDRPPQQVRTVLVDLVV